MRYFRRGTHRNGALTVAGIQAEYDWHLGNPVVVIRAESTYDVIHRAAKKRLSQRAHQYGGQLAGIAFAGLMETFDRQATT